MIGFVICGVEHSGTTLVSDLFRQVPGIDAGFEVGVLLADTPRAFPALSVHAEITRWGWGLDEAALEACCNTDDFLEFYRRLQAASVVIWRDTHTIFDKTPRYLADLGACMRKLRVPFFVTFKDPRAIVYSDWRNSGAPEFFAWFADYAPVKVAYVRTMYAEYQRAMEVRDPLFCPIRLEELCVDTRRTCERMYAHVGCAFSPAYMVLRGVRYENTRFNAVSAGVPFEYYAHFDAAVQAEIARVFGELGDWFYE